MMSADEESHAEYFARLITFRLSGVRSARKKSSLRRRSRPFFSFLTAGTYHSFMMAKSSRERALAERPDVVLHDHVFIY